MPLLIKNGRVLDPASNTYATLAVLPDVDRISQVGAISKQLVRKFSMQQA